MLTLIDDAVDRGASVLVGGGVPTAGLLRGAHGACRLDPGSALASTEIFGPVAAIQTFTGLDDAIAARTTPSGVWSAYVATRDIDHALNVAERLEVGMVGINTGVVSSPRRPSAA